MFSVVLRLSQPQGTNGHLVQEGQLAVLFPENLPDIGPLLQAGRQLLLHEGSRIVGVCTVANALPATT
jgi:hypothetical protein